MSEGGRCSGKIQFRGIITHPALVNRGGKPRHGGAHYAVLAVICVLLALSILGRGLFCPPPPCGANEAAEGVRRDEVLSDEEKEPLMAPQGVA